MKCNVLALAIGSALLASCISLTELPRALTLRGDDIQVRTLPCNRETARRASSDRSSASLAELDPQSIRLLTWNIHKEDDAGWQRDLAHFVRDNDIVLLQEAVLKQPLRQVIEDSGLRWIMASSFRYRGNDIGVLTATRVPPYANCTQRVVEPLLRIPKSAVLSWFDIKGTSAKLAVVNVHAINFSLSLDGYRAQFEALADALAAHDGPMVLAGDLNTWTDGRGQVVETVAQRLQLKEIPFKIDQRTRFFNKQLDHIFVRGIEVLEAQAIPVKSSDHNPVAAILRLAPH